MDPRREIRSAIFKSNLIGAMLPRMFLGIIIIVLWNIIEPYGIHLPQYIWVAIFCLFVLVLIWNAERRTQLTMQDIDEIIAGELDATDLLEQYSDSSLPLISSLFNIDGGFDDLELLLSKNKEVEMSKRIDWKGGEIYETRGKDILGPAQGGKAESFDDILGRIDAMSERPEFEDLAGPLTKTEKLVAEANSIAAEKALDEWIKAESNDPEIIEAGVENLGDLVASGYFKGPKKGI